MNTENTEVAKVRGRPKDTSFPKFITCKVTGKQFKINITQLRKQLERKGQTVEDYVSKYISREGKAILEETNDPTMLNPVVNETIRDEVIYELNERIASTEPTDRKDLLKTLWNKIAQQPPEFYHEKFKLQAKK